MIATNETLNVAPRLGCVGDGDSDGDGDGDGDRYGNSVPAIKYNY